MNEDETHKGDENAIRIKREPVDDSDIKDYAETTMNELLGWYGYGKVDSRDTQGLNLHRFTSSGSSPPGDGASADDASRDRSPPASGNGSSKVTDPPNLPSGYIVCAWCQKVGMKLFTLKTATGQKAFCSELCFTQCRRASFKKNKVCDWCKHIRHTVNYVDFQDGEQQLQFCSDKCLNQYKMNIFCRETQAHLQMHPHLQDAAKLAAAAGGAGTSGVTLITPDLWLRDCHSSHENSNPSGINGHDGKSESASHSGTPKMEEGTPTTVGNSITSTKLSTKISHKDGLYRHNSRLRDRDKHRRHRNLTKSSSSVVVSLPTTSQLDAADTGTPLTSPKSSGSSINGGGGSCAQGQSSTMGSGQPSPNLPMRVLTSPIPGNPGTGPPSISPHAGIPPQVLAAAAAAVAASAHPHSNLMNPNGDMPRPPFVPPFLPPYPFLAQPPDLMRLPPAAGLRPGQHPFLFPPGLGIPMGGQPGSSQSNANAAQTPLLNPLFSSLLPPVSMLIPYPVVLPIPIPIPVPIPLPFPARTSVTTTTTTTVTNTTATSSITSENLGFKKLDETQAVNSVSGNFTCGSFANRDILGRAKNASGNIGSSVGSARSTRQSNSSSAKRVDSVITRLVAPKLAQAELMAKLSGGIRLHHGEDHNPEVAMYPGLDDTRLIPTSTVATSISSLAVSSVGSSAMTSSMDTAFRRGLESSSDQSNGLDDSSDISDFPDSDALDLADMESEDSRQSEGRLPVRNFAGVSGESSSGSLPRLSSPLASSLNFTNRDRDKEVGDEGLTRDSVDGEPELKRKCVRTRLIAK